MRQEIRNRQRIEVPEIDFSSTFNTFFAERQPTLVCTDCIGDDNLEVLYTPEEGGTVWICPDCKAKREAERQESIRKGQARMATWAAMDEWEEA